MTAKIWAGSFLTELKLGLGGHLKVSQASLQPQAGMVLLSGSSGVQPGPQITQPQQHPPTLLLPDPGRTELWAAVPLLSLIYLQTSRACPAAPALSRDACLSSITPSPHPLLWGAQSLLQRTGANFAIPPNNFWSQLRALKSSYSPVGWRVVLSFRDTDAMGSAQGNLDLLDPRAKPSLGALGQTWGWN